MDIPIEKLNQADLLDRWRQTLKTLQQSEQENPHWHWPVVQDHLETLHALARELSQREAQERAQWQP